MVSEKSWNITSGCCKKLIYNKSWEKYCCIYLRPSCQLYFVSSCGNAYTCSSQVRFSFSCVVFEGPKAAEVRNPSLIQRWSLSYRNWTLGSRRRCPKPWLLITMRWSWVCQAQARPLPSPAWSVCWWRAANLFCSLVILILLWTTFCWSSNR